MLAENYFSEVQELCGSIQDDPLREMDEPAQNMAETIMEGGLIHAFGSGHSDIIAKEITGRAGGLVPVNRIVDPTEGMAERVEGYAETLLDEYEKQYGLKSGEGMIVISNSGRNPLPVEMAKNGKDRGLFTIAITSLPHSKKVDSRHSSGKKLYELADYVLNTCVPFGDTLVQLSSSPQGTGAGSTIAGALVANMLMLTVTNKIELADETPPVLKSANIDGADEYNKKLMEKYGNRLAW